MATVTAHSTVSRTRITIDLTPQLRREIRVAAALRDESITRYVTEAIEQRAHGGRREEGWWK